MLPKLMKNATPSTNAKVNEADVKPAAPAADPKIAAEADLAEATAALDSLNRERQELVTLQADELAQAEQRHTADLVALDAKRTDVQDRVRVAGKAFARAALADHVAAAKKQLGELTLLHRAHDDRLRDWARSGASSFDRITRERLQSEVYNPAGVVRETLARTYRATELALANAAKATADWYEHASAELQRVLAGDPVADLKQRIGTMLETYKALVPDARPAPEMPPTVIVTLRDPREDARQTQAIV